MTALLLIAALTAPPTLADGLRAIGALNTLDHSLDAPEPPKHTGASLLISGSALVAFSGLMGTLLSPRCTTWDADLHCTHAQGALPIFPTMLVLGLGGLTSGVYWYRQDLP